MALAPMQVNAGCAARLLADTQMFIDGQSTNRIGRRWSTLLLGGFDQLAGEQLD